MYAVLLLFLQDLYYGRPVLGEAMERRGLEMRG